MSESGKGDEAAWSNDTQKMIEKLKEMHFYEETMTRDQMVGLLQAIQQAQDEPNPGVTNKNVNMSPEVMRHENQASYSRGPNAKVSNRESSSPELSASQMRKSLSQGKRAGSGDESIFSQHGRNYFAKENKDAQPANMNKARHAINENSSETIDNKQSVQRTNSLMRHQETPKHRINPLDTAPNMSDVPLQPYNRTVPGKDSTEVGNFVNIETVLPQLSGHLQRVAESWLSQHGSFARAQPPWGKPIQVGTDNGSLDKESVADAMSEDAGPSEASVNCDADKGRRSCARKVVDYTAGEVTESNSDEEFEPSSRTKKAADSSDKSYQPKEAVGNASTRKRRITSKKDDIYEWGETNEENVSDEDTRKNTKKIKLAKRTKTSSKETVSSESTKKNANVDDEADVSDCETVIEDNGSDGESRKGTKRRKPTKTTVAAKKAASAPTGRRKSVEPLARSASEKQDDPPVCIDDSDEIIISDNEESNHASQKSSRTRSEDAISSTSSVYPRRVVPPNPKRKFSGINARKPLMSFSNQTRGKKPPEQDEEDGDEEGARGSRNSRSNSGLQDCEITAALESVDEVKVTIPPVDLEIRPLRVSGRMKMQLEHLKALQAAEEQEESQRAKQRRAKEEQEQREKEEKIKERVKEANLKIRREKQEEKAKAAVEERWNSMLNQKGKKRQGERTELNPEGPRQNNDPPIVEVVQDDHVETRQNVIELVNPDGRGREQPTTRVPCPICGNKYPVKQIEDHAANCEEFEATSSAGASSSNSPTISTRSTSSVQRGTSSKLLECIVCSAFSTTDGKKYEDHVNKCIAKQTARGTDGNSYHKSEAAIVVPDSPIRSLRRVSEQTDSEINYRGQFAPKTKSKISENRKRKRL